MPQDEELQDPASPHAVMEDLRAAEDSSREARQALSSPRWQSPRRSASTSGHQGPSSSASTQQATSTSLGAQASRELPASPPASHPHSRAISPPPTARQAPAQQPGPPVAAPPAAETSFFGLDEEDSEPQAPAQQPAGAGQEDLLQSFAQPAAADDLFGGPAPQAASQARAASAVDSWDIFNTPSAQPSQVRGSRRIMMGVLATCRASPGHPRTCSLQRVCCGPKHCPEAMSLGGLQ